MPRIKRKITVKGTLMTCRQLKGLYEQWELLYRTRYKSYPPSEITCLYIY